MSECKNGKIRRILLLFFVILLGVVIWGIVCKDALHKDIIPPLPTGNDCTLVENEIKKYDWDAELALAVAKSESQCNVKAFGDEDLIYVENGRSYGYSVGVFQVRILPGREQCDGYDLETNVACAYEIYREHYDFSPWSAYTTGKYKWYTWHSLL